MCKALWVLPAILLFVATCAPSAHADTYSITFTCTPSTVCTAPTSGTFTYDPTTQTLSTIDVSWDGATFEISATPNEELGSLSSCYGSDTGQVAVFDLLSTCGPNEPPPSTEGCGAGWVGNPDPAKFTFEDYGSNCAFLLSISETLSDTSLPGNYSTGTWTITDISAPEPATLSLLLLGCALIFAGRKRLSFGARP